MTNEKIRELSIWTTVFTVCGIIPFAVATLADGGRLAFVARLLEVIN